jgi:hypothetical protein
MELKEHIYEQINTVPARIQLALALNCSEATIRNYIRNHDDNLTKAVALSVIRQITGLPMEKILSDTIPQLQK